MCPSESPVRRLDVEPAVVLPAVGVPTPVAPAAVAPIGGVSAGAVPASVETVTAGPSTCDVGCGGPTPDLPLAARARAEGPDRLEAAELVALVLTRSAGGPSAGPSVRTVARAQALLDAFGELGRLAVATPGELAFRGRLPPAAALRLASAFALGRRTLERPWPRSAPVRSAADIVDRYVARLRHLRHERFLTVLVDAKNRVLRDELVGDGGLSSVSVHPREAFGAALREGASGVVFVHNHPSGDPEPSPVDDDLTRRLLAVGELLGIRVLDHIVVGDGRYVSYRDRGIVPPA